MAFFVPDPDSVSRLDGMNDAIGDDSEREHAAEWRLSNIARVRPFTEDEMRRMSVPLSDAVLRMINRRLLNDDENQNLLINRENLEEVLADREARRPQQMAEAEARQRRIMSERKEELKRKRQKEEEERTRPAEEALERRLKQRAIQNRGSGMFRIGWKP